mgnify:CR=1 FL=1
MIYLVLFVALCGTIHEMLNIAEDDLPLYIRLLSIVFGLFIIVICVYALVV